MGHKPQKAVPPGTNKPGPRGARSSSSIWSPWMFLSAIGLACLAYFARNFIGPKGPRALRLIDLPRVTDAEQFHTPAHAAKYLWGTYRPHVYFGMRTKTPESILTGIMWFSHQRQFALRHTCEHGDNLAKFGWLRHDGHSFGQQQIIDGDIELETSFLKKVGDARGGDWTARISGQWKGAKDGNPKALSLFFYVANEGREKLDLRYEQGNPFTVVGRTQVLGDFAVTVSDIEGTQILTSAWGTYAPHMHNLTQLVTNGLIEGMRAKRAQVPMLPDTVAKDDERQNLAVVQLVLQLPFTADITFTSQPKPLAAGEKPVHSDMHGHRLSELLSQNEAEFDSRFKSTFHVDGQSLASLVSGMPDPSNPNATIRADGDEAMEFARAAFSNLIGGVGYFYGQSLVKGDGTEGKALPQPHAGLLTAVPSRAFFPRGFMWDEGFHQLLIQRWDRQLSKEILAHWFDLMNVDGWIGREQILGEEARSKVPDEFVVQNDRYANPPTFFIAIEQLMDTIDTEALTHDDISDLDFLRRIYPRLQAWYDWYARTQKGELPTAYRWRGRDEETDRELNPKTLTSGLDDYPRASHPSPAERHLDLRCWMQLGARVLARISTFIGQPDARYDEIRDALADNAVLDKLHWSKRNNMYADYGLDTNAVRLQKVVEGQQLVMKRVVTKKPATRFLDHFGYVSLFPLLMAILDPKSPHLGATLTALRDQNKLWTGFGLRSLSKDSPMYMQRNTEHDPPYWRGPVWLNINYMSAKALKHYSEAEGPYQDLAREAYTALRKGIVANMYKEYQRTAYVWEQYDVEAGTLGHGKGTKPFTGWSSLVLLMVAELY